MSYKFEMRDTSPQEEEKKEEKEKVSKPEKRAEELSFEKVITPEHLEMISQASGGFRFRPDPSLSPVRTGYTDLKSKTIYYNPLFLSGASEIGIKPRKKDDIK